MGLQLLAILAIPVLLMLHAPVLAALVPGALLTIASLERGEQRALDTAQLVDANDIHELHRVAAALPIHASSRRVS